MKKPALLVLAAAFGFVPCARAQEHTGFFNNIEVGAFGQYTKFQATHTNSVGLGGRLSFGASRHVGLEAEMGYDFSRVFTEGFGSSSGGGALIETRSNFQMLDGLFGPKFQTRGPVRIFFTAKGGFIHTGFSTEPATFSTFSSTVESLRLHTIDGAAYPGLGVEGFLGPIGLRLEAGDLIYFRNGMHNDLQVTLGPSIRF